MKSYLVLLFILALSALLVFHAQAAVNCPQTFKTCPDGKTHVGPTGPNCKWAACPGEKLKDDPVVCPMIAKLCQDGSYVSPKGPKCEMPACPGGEAKQQIPPPPVDAEPSDEDDSCDNGDCASKKSDQEND